MLRKYQSDAIPLNEVALSRMNGLMGMKEMLGKLAMTKTQYYERRAYGAYPFAIFRIKKKCYCRAAELEDWILAGQPSIDEGWLWSKVPMPAYLFKYKEDYEGQFMGEMEDAANGQ